MSCRYDMLVLDLDGTLLREDGTVSPRDAAAVRRAQDEGLIVGIATGRAVMECQHLLSEIEHTAFTVTAGGAMMTEGTSHMPIARRVMPIDLVHFIADAISKAGHLVHLLKDRNASGYDYLIGGTGSLAPATEWWFDTMPVSARHVTTLEDDTHPHDTLRIGTVASGSELAPLADELRDQLGDRAFLQHWSAVTETAAIGAETHLLECFDADVDKWTMIAVEADRLGIVPERITTIGDGLNDVRMVREAGLGIAMANADARVMHVADHVTGDHNSCGVAQAIDRILAGAI